MTDPLGGVIRLEYDDRRLPVAHIDQENNRTTFEYDETTELFDLLDLSPRDLA